MLIKKPDEIKGREITPPETYFNRRNFLRGAALVASAYATGKLYRQFAVPDAPPQSAARLEGVQPAAAGVPVVGDPRTAFEDITHYNNFYEFATDKSSVARRAQGFVARPWTVKVDGLVQRPREFDLDDLLKLAPAEERVYRFRCVEGWSMIIPWVGFPLARLLAAVEPLGQARYVAFQTLHDPKRMPGQNSSVLDWPYVEGLRLDEATHPLTLLASGLYGQTLLPQNGAPLRLVVPWKYGFKSIKSIVRVQLTSEQPPTTWNLAAPDEYGFYSNVNPNVDHPRWSQRRERRIGEFGMRDTLLFNGYAEQVGPLYAGLDLRANF
ncbi:MAG TPA: protein-methionine-sulfoxide reductase catalytic subunit MsrP [Pyrinomonadaceae bacterium]|jgi:sulfoxide reductase catalytic subunit YedY